MIIKTFSQFLHSIRMSGKSIIFKNKKIDKTNFYKYKKLFKIDDTNTNAILVSTREPYDHSL